MSQKEPIITDALVVHKIGQPFTLAKVQLASIHPDEALVEVEAVGICHTDISCAHGVLPATAPAVLGHEGAGTVLEVGSNVTHVQPGDKVLLSMYYCGTCEECTDGHPAYCHDNLVSFSGARPDGTHSMRLASSGEEIFSSFFGQSSFARHTLVQKNCIIKVPFDTNLPLFAPLGCGLQTGAGSVLNTLNVKEGCSLVVFGVGPVGMSALMAGKIRGANPLIAIDLQQTRLEIAKKLGATHTILGNEPDIVDKIRKLCPPTGAKFAVDCSGVPAVVEKMIECLGKRGKAATVGAASPGVKVGVEIFQHIVMGREYVGCAEGDSVPSEIAAYLMQQHAEGNYPLDEIVTFYDMKDHEKAIRDMEEGKVMKPVLKW